MSNPGVEGYYSGIDSRGYRAYMIPQIQPKSIDEMDTGDPVHGAYSFNRIGHFRARARQLTSQAFGRVLYA